MRLMAEQDGQEVRLGVFAQFGAKYRKATVAVHVADYKPVYVSPSEAREFALAMIAAAYVAETETGIVRWFEEHMDVHDDQRLAAILVDFRRWRIESQMPGGGVPG
jgi:hypothetical protein